MAEPIVAIVGAGPAGVRAAETLARGGVRPILFDEARAAGRPDLPPAAEGRRTRRDRAFTGSRRRRPKRSTACCPISPTGSTTGRGRSSGTCSRTGSISSRPEGYGEQRFDRLILATGAMDRALPFPGWTLPGVFTLGGAQIALKAQGCRDRPPRRAWSAPGRCCRSSRINMRRPGADVVAVLDVTPFAAKLTQLPGLHGGGRRRSRRASGTRRATACTD